MLAFAPLALVDRERYTTYYAACSEKCAEYSFFALWGWNESEPAEVAWTPGLCWLRGRGHRDGLLAPIGDWSAVDWPSIFETCLKPGDRLLDVPEALLRHVPSDWIRKLSVTELRDEWEYVHSVEELVALKGGKYSPKRAHVKAFTENLAWDYRPLLPEDFSELLDFQARWCALRHCNESPLLNAEDKAVRRALELWDVLPFTGAMVRVDGLAAGYTIAEELAPDTIGIRFEKAYGDEYAGIYQALNKLFLERQGRGYRWVNREEDMGNPGLRDAKMSYHPSRFVKKYEVAYLGGIE